MNVLYMLCWLLLKHFLADFVFQTPYQFQNKGKYGHPGGILHAAITGACTFVVLIWFLPLPLSVLLSCLEALVHYHIDYAKVDVTTSCGWKADTHPEYWYALGFDQFLHQFCYVIIAAVATAHGV